MAAHFPAPPPVQHTVQLVCLLFELVLADLDFYATRISAEKSILCSNARLSDLDLSFLLEVKSDTKAFKIIDHLCCLIEWYGLWGFFIYFTCGATIKIAYVSLKIKLFTKVLIEFQTI